MKNSIIINLIGAPGSGKSTLAACLFGEMKKQGFSVDLVTEYTKELIWEERNATFDDELYIFAKQNHRLFRVNGKVDFIVTDAPILQKLYYMPKEFDFSNLVIDVYNQYNNLNYFLSRKWWDFESNGRNQTAEESKEIENIMLNKLNNYNIVYDKISSETSTDEDIKRILNDISKLVNKE